MNLFALLFLASLLIIGVSLINWRTSIKIALVLVIIEGALRKWVLPQSSEVVYFLKDLFFIGSYIHYFSFLPISRTIIAKQRTIAILVLLSFAWCLFQVFNPSLGSVLAGVLGLKSYFLYIPLIWMVPSLFNSRQELYNILRFYLILAFPVGLLGIVQYYSPSFSPINVYASGEEASAFVGSGLNQRVRVSGTFSYLGSYAVYVQFCLCLLVPFLQSKQSKLWELFCIATSLLVVVNILMTGSRTPVIATCFVISLYLVIKGISQPRSVLSSYTRFLIPIVIISCSVVFWFPDALDALVERATSSDSVSERSVGSLVEPFEFVRFKELDGYGTGATNQAVSALRLALNLPIGEKIPIGYESEPGRVMLEVGPLGFALWYALRIVLLFALWRAFRQLRNPFLKDLALIVFLLQLIHLPSFIVFNPTASIYYWFLGGFIFLLPRLERLESRQQE